MGDLLSVIAWIAIGLGLSSAIVVGLDILAGHRQRMAIMNLVWPLTALYSGPLGLWAYLEFARNDAHGAGSGHDGGHGGHRNRPFAVAAGFGATHCGSGCCLGDIVAETFVAFVPVTLLGSAILATWTLDYALAFVFGIAFQYFTIKPMRNLSPMAGLKADVLSLTAWQIGMYGWMALATFVIFGHELGKSEPVFWFMMQIAMLAGFLVSWPMNAWLIRKGIKERM